jgi:hypothetical protein
MRVWSVDFTTGPRVRPGLQDRHVPEDLPENLRVILLGIDGVTAVTTGGHEDGALSARFCVKALGPAQAFTAGLEVFRTALEKIGVDAEVLAGEVEDFQRIAARRERVRATN